MPKRCRHCKTEIVDPTPWKKPFCSYQCGIQYVRAKQNEKRAKAYRKEKREWKEANKTYGELCKETQTVCNQYIRARDAGHACMSCGKNSGAKMNAGHYRSVGSSPELRFHPFNINLQCEWCNSYLSGNQTEYRKGLVKKIGEKNVLWLEGPHETQNWTHEDIREIKQYYKDKIKGLKDV